MCLDRRAEIILLVYYGSGVVEDPEVPCVSRQAYSHLKDERGIRARGLEVGGNIQIHNACQCTKTKSPVAPVKLVRSKDNLPQTKEKTI